MNMGQLVVTTLHTFTHKWPTCGCPKPNSLPFCIAACIRMHYASIHHYAYTSQPLFQPLFQPNTPPKAAPFFSSSLLGATPDAKRQTRSACTLARKTRLQAVFARSAWRVTRDAYPLRLRASAQARAKARFARFYAFYAFVRAARAYACAVPVENARRPKRRVLPGAESVRWGVVLPIYTTSPQQLELVPSLSPHSNSTPHLHHPYPIPFPSS